jgi:hypothetical protein
MSHIANYATEIQHPDLNLLTQAFQVVAETHGGQVGSQVFEFSNSYEQAVQLGLTTPDFQRGIGINIGPDGKLAFVGDPYNAQEQWDELQQEILNTFTALGFNDALLELGYGVEIEQSNGEIQLTALA